MNSLTQQVPTKGILRQTGVSSEVALGRMAAQWLDNEVAFETSFLQTLFH